MICPDPGVRSWSESNSRVNTSSCVLSLDDITHEVRVNAAAVSKRREHKKSILIPWTGNMRDNKMMWPCAGLFLHCYSCNNTSDCTNVVTTHPNKHAASDSEAHEESGHLDLPPLGVRHPQRDRAQQSREHALKNHLQSKAQGTRVPLVVRPHSHARLEPVSDTHALVRTHSVLQLQRGDRTAGCVRDATESENAALQIVLEHIFPRYIRSVDHRVSAQKKDLSFRGNTNDICVPLRPM